MKVSDTPPSGLGDVVKSKLLADDGRGTSYDIGPMSGVALKVVFSL